MIQRLKKNVHCMIFISNERKLLFYWARIFCAMNENSYKKMFAKTFLFP